MDNCPEQAAAADGEKIYKTEEPGKAKLTCIGHGADCAKNEPDNRSACQQQRQPAETTWLEIFAFRRGQNLRTLTHFFGGSGLGPGLLSGGFASACSSFANSSGGTSAATAFWLRCKARR